MKTSTGIGINAGAMRERVTIQARAEQQDSAGELQLSWNIFARARAELMRTPGREVFDSIERNARVPTTFKLRFLDGVLPKMRLIDSKSRVFNIVSAMDPTGRREELLVTCLELVEDTP